MYCILYDFSEGNNGLEGNVSQFHAGIHLFFLFLYKDRKMPNATFVLCVEFFFWWIILLIPCAMFLVAWKLVSSTGRNWKEPELLFWQVVTRLRTCHYTICKTVTTTLYLKKKRKKKKMFLTWNISNNSLVGINININIVNDYFVFQLLKNYFVCSQTVQNLSCKKKKKKIQKCRATIGNLQVYISFLLPSQMFG